MARNSASFFPMSLRVLSCSPNLDLAMLRAAVLRTAQCEVVCPVSQVDAFAIMLEEKFDVLLICYDYSDEAGQEICDAFKKSNPAGRIIALRKSHRDAACDDVHDAVFTLDGPAVLIRAVLSTDPR